MVLASTAKFSGFVVSVVGFSTLLICETLAFFKSLSMLKKCLACNHMKEEEIDINATIFADI